MLIVGVWRFGIDHLSGQLRFKVGFNKDRWYLGMNGQDLVDLD